MKTTTTLKALLFNIQRFSIQDGPGIRTTVFFKGCPLTCPWCSNPEGMKALPEIMTHDRRCIACGKCAEACPENAISLLDDRRTIHWPACTTCLECARVCPSLAIEVVGKYRTLSEVLDTVSRDARFYRNTGGGVTASGGEPLVQWEFVRELFRECKRVGIHTALDTTAHCKWEHMEEVLGFTDLILFDVKNMDSEKHRETCGVTNELILTNLEKAAKSTEIWMRIPLIPHFNDSEENVRSLADLARKIQAAKVSLLHFHAWGKQKYPRLGKTYSFHESVPMDPESEVARRRREILESCR